MMSSSAAAAMLPRGSPTGAPAPHVRHVSRSAAKTRDIFSADRDIGRPARRGSASFHGGVYTLKGSGADIWGSSDQFNFAFLKFTGDGQIIARVDSLDNTDPWAKAGIMFRQSLTGNSADAYVVMTPHDQVQLLDRTGGGAVAGDAGDSFNQAFPVWEKLVRTGNTFEGFCSSDGINWTQLGNPVTVPMGRTAYVGLVTNAHNDGAIARAAFDNVQMMAAPASGVYRILTRAQPKTSLTVQTSGSATSTALSLSPARSTSDQQWLVESQGDGTFKIYAYSGQNSLLVLDDSAGVTADATAITAYQDNGGLNQRWIFEPAVSGFWRLVPATAGAGSMQGMDMSAVSSAQILTYNRGSSQLFSLRDPGQEQILPSPKKGLAGYPNEIASIHPSWIYNWSGNEPANLSGSVEFVPMEWGYYGNSGNTNVNWLNYVKAQSGVQEVLGYNEPDSTSQANLSVSSALDGWQYLQQTGLPLGSPAAVHADDSWMQQFMAGAAQRGYRVDFVTIHWYGGNDPAGFLAYVDHIHAMYGKPVWITEFAPVDWSGGGGVTAADAYSFMQQVIPVLNSRSYVQRYAWFSPSASDQTMGQDALYDSTGGITPLGRLYSRM